MHGGVGTGEPIPNEIEVRIQLDDSIIQDTAAEKTQSATEVGVTMDVRKYRIRWYGEEEPVARARAILWYSLDN
ncbi:hypothetical protein [Adlercreutzia sp. ZJ242]|uniref:hypothetical protein n=1 Tax=Adlercreutzia sp. ZJ242 TaxID=2709409 RepID=UPI00197E0B9D|nr:hypothetical protein [Adlercreutzia sp. ZJ242]